MATTYLEKDIPLTEEQIERTGELDPKDGTVVLRVEVCYMKDARRRGIKLMINRIVKTDTGFSTFPMSKYNGLLHLADLGRVNHKAGEAWAATVERNIDKIAEIALASEDPDFAAIFPVLADGQVAA